MKKQILLQIDKESYCSDYGFDWVYEHLKTYIIGVDHFETFDTFVLPKSRKVMFKLLDMMLTLSLMIDIFHDGSHVEPMASMLSNFNHAVVQGV